MSVVNGSDLYMWMDGELIGYSTSYTITMNMETRPRTNKGSGIFRSVLPGMLNLSASCDGLYVFDDAVSLIVNAQIARLPVTLNFGIKDPDTGLVDIDEEHFGGDYLITKFELNATDAENATWSASFEFYDNFGAEYEAVDIGGYYIAPTGSDATGDGSFTNPWFTINGAWASISAGDTLYVRGGTYVYTSTNTLSNKDGTAGNLISILNYPGESPVFDYSAGVPYVTQKIGFSITHVDYLKIRGIRVTGLTQPVAGDIGMYGILLWHDVNHSTFERIETDHVGGWGVVIGDDCTDLLFLNCDSHHNSDPYSTSAYGWSDGFECGSATSTNITFRGCRAWWNSDDGWDLRLANGVFTLDNCWSFWNGYIPGTFTHAGNGEGFKLGPKTIANTTDVLRVLTNCVAFENYSIQFGCLTAGYYTFYSELTNCIAYKSATQRGFQFDAAMVSEMHNCVDYDNSAAPSVPGDTGSNNTWDTAVTVTDADFKTLVSSASTGSRQDGGSLPLVDFLHLAAGSDLIAAGVNVGLSYDCDGVAWNIPPSMGAYEYV